MSYELLKRRDVKGAIGGASAWVVANDAHSAIKDVAQAMADSGAYGDLVQVSDGTDDESEASTAQSAIQSTGGKLKIIGTVNVQTADLTIDADTELDLTDGQIVVDAARTLTINGSITDTHRQIFTINGTLTLGSHIEARPEWFGAVGDGSTDDYAALDQAFTSAVTVLLSNRYYFSETTLNIGSGGRAVLHLRGAGRKKSAIIGNGGDGKSVLEIISATEGSIRDLSLWSSTQRSVTNAGLSTGGTPATIGLLMARNTSNNDCSRWHIEHVEAETHSDGTANGGDGTVGYYNALAETVHVESCHFEGDTAEIYTSNSGTTFSSLDGHEESIKTDSGSMTNVKVTGGEAWGYTLNSIRLHGGAHYNFDGHYLSNSASAVSATPGTYAVLVSNGIRSVYMRGVNVEVWDRFMRVLDSSLRHSDIHFRMSFNAGEPLIYLDTDSSTTSDVSRSRVKPEAVAGSSSPNLIESDASVGGRLLNNELWLNTAADGNLGLATNNTFGSSFMRGNVIYGTDENVAWHQPRNNIFTNDLSEVGTSKVVEDRSDIDGMVKTARRTIAHGALTDADAQQDIDVLDLPADTVIEEVGWKVTTQFAFGGTGTVEAEIGVSGATTRYADAIDIDGGTPEGIASISGTNIPDLRGAATTVTARFDSANENLDQTTAGSIDIWVRYYSVPVSA